MKRFWLRIIFSIALLGAVSNVFGLDKGCKKIEYRSGSGKIPKNVIKDTEKFIRSQQQNQIKIA
ncbi:MAG: hypothetical protein ACFFD1_02575 [Candidatus Thorarchaeota archaeon]